jgi:hypothetical protein
MGIGLRIMPGVRISASSRGIRAGVGPRAARVHVGSGGVGLSTGAGPLTLYTGARGGSRSRGSSPAAYERRLAQAERVEAIQELADLERQLVSVHLEDFSPAQRPEAPPGPPPTQKALFLKQALKEAREGVSFFDRSGRRAARERAAGRAAHQAEEEDARAQAVWRQQHAELEEFWTHLTNNDPETVLATLEQAFSDNEAPAAAVGCSEDGLAVVMKYPTPDFLPEKKPAVTPSGKPTLHKRTKTERNELYAESLASNVLATVKEAFAVAPGVNEIAVLVVRKEESLEFRTYLSCIYSGAFERSELEEIDWHRVEPLRELFRAPDAQLVRKGATAEVTPLKVRDDEAIRPVLEAAAEGLECEPNLLGKVIR